jgi:hypothetical protein
MVDESNSLHLAGVSTLDFQLHLIIWELLIVPLSGYGMKSYHNVQFMGNGHGGQRSYVAIPAVVGGLFRSNVNGGEIGCQLR